MDGEPELARYCAFSETDRPVSRRSTGISIAKQWEWVAHLRYGGCAGDV